MQKSVIDIFSLDSSELLTTRNVHIVVNDTADLLHCAHIIIRYKNLIKFAEGVGSTKHIFIVANSMLADSEPILGNISNKLF